jgi:hypothetical protein
MRNSWELSEYVYAHNKSVHKYKNPNKIQKVYVLY